MQHKLSTGVRIKLTDLGIPMDQLRESEHERTMTRISCLKEWSEDDKSNSGDDSESDISQASSEDIQAIFAQKSQDI